MEYTKNYKLPQWVETDRIQMEHFNKAMADIDGGMTSAQGIGDRGMRNVRNLLYNLCQLTYQQDGRGTYTGFREGFDFDGLNADHRVVSTTGAAILEPDNGRARLAAEGWAGGNISWTKSSVAMTGGATAEILSNEWSPVGFAKAASLSFAVDLDTTSATRTVDVYVELLRGTEVLATTNTQTSNNAGEKKTYTFGTKATLSPHEVYTLKMVMTNNIINANYTVNINTSITFTATAVKNTTGSITAEPLGLSGSEIIAWVQYSAPGSVTMELLDNGAWTAMELESERDSKTPEGTACTEGRFKLVLPGETDSVQLRININSGSECFVYGYGATAL